MVVAFPDVGGNLCSLFVGRICRQIAELEDRLDATVVEVADGLLTASDNLNLDALLFLRLDKLLGFAEHVAVETACKPTIRRDHNDDGTLHLVMRDQQRLGIERGVFRRADQHVGDAVSPRKRIEHTVGGATDLRRRDHLHRARNLLRRGDGVDSPFYVVKVGHMIPTLHRRRKLGLERLDSGIQLGLGLVGELLLGLDALNDGRLRRMQVLDELATEANNIGNRDIVEVAVTASIDGDSLIVEGHRDVTTLLQKLGHVSAAVQLILRRLVEVAAELRECLQLAVSGQVEAQGAATDFIALV